MDDHGYAWKHEPEYQAELGLAAPLPTKPDFLIERDGARGVAEVRPVRDHGHPRRPTRPADI
jgi:hypothetical protein